MDKLAIRNIMPEDNPALAKIIRDTLTEFNANKPGTVFYDDATDHLFESFQQPLAAYFIVLWDGVINGGAGIYPTDELPPGTCELVKMYLLPAMRAKGVGKMLIAKCVEEAVARGFKKPVPRNDAGTVNCDTVVPKLRL